MTTNKGTTSRRNSQRHEAKEIERDIRHANAHKAPFTCGTRHEAPS